ncbi:cytochrome c oxidase cbb3-type subunit 1 [Chryseobacterium sp. SORGH_AS 447]|uniref:cbb3-type cytochrome c oxidase subunit I n=1 Tax=Chryseobacterium sp. SORGH_AS_0447 TaxID=3041769 RepID=UPI002787D447|nr:cbb3-type cytochrome c oxidase subunit I [Chryseobacterium sp. SORGH_AS_0447]MDQ1160010.1 cytochrome c oxidase cbb3-type subunit 1 [Chryseobacterium sp. SORGH_AS_0447]
MADSPLFNQTGIQLTLALMLIIIVAGLVIVVLKFLSIYSNILKQREWLEAEKKRWNLSPEERAEYEKQLREAEQDQPENQLSGNLPPSDTKGVIRNINSVEEFRIFPTKRRNSSFIKYISPELTRLILWFLGTAIAWLVIGTTFGLYAGIKYVVPDVEHTGWLSFGRLRPAHTNAVFWGWASLAMVGLSYYVVTRVSNVENYNIRQGYISLILINAAVLAGTISLLAGVNNGGGEYREYIWPIMITFGIGIAFSTHNLFRPVVKRIVKEIYISNWYVISGFMFIIIVILVGYIPVWQNGVGETITQGYYMHQAIGMWFMMINLGLMYYFLPQQLNKPIYSYSLGALAFWSHTFFYTLIGTHHFIFSAIPWRLQTTAIIASVGMLIPVAAGTTNFIMTFNGAWYQLKTSYTLPFYFMSIIFYFTGSLQGTVEAFRYTNLLWHFTDFTVSHSHLTMYGIITFMIWAFSYTLIPRLTGKEPPKLLVGIHFWLALIGLLMYVIALMIGGTETGLMWMKKKPFIDGVINMFPFWLWRAIGGTFMWISHLIFAYNFYCMVRKKESVRVPKTPAEVLAAKRQFGNTEFNS